MLSVSGAVWALGSKNGYSWAALLHSWWLMTPVADKPRWSFPLGIGLAPEFYLIAPILLRFIHRFIGFLQNDVPITAIFGTGSDTNTHRDRLLNSDRICIKAGLRNKSA